MNLLRITLLTALVTGATAAPAQAQWVATGYLGVNVGGDVETGKGGYGGSIGYVGDALGVELDVQRYYHFFKDADVADLVPNRGIDLDTDARSVMVNVVAPIRTQRSARFRPYGTAGLGVVRAVFETTFALADTDQNNLGFNVGGGVLYSLNHRLGLRSDLRYFRAFVDEDQREGAVFKDYGFWRATLGVTFTFAK